jgi:phosphohistidine phosphatase
VKTLYLLRHAKAEAGNKILSDMDRPLSPRGREACAVIGNYMTDKHYKPDLVLCSSSKRTQETFELVWQGKEQPKIQFEKRLYLATAEEIIASLHMLDEETHCVLVIGHNPGMHHVALLLSEEKLTENRHALELKYPTGSLTALNFDCNNWQGIMPGEGKIQDFITPDDLIDKES